MSEFSNVILARTRDLVRDLFTIAGEDATREGLLKTPDRFVKAWLELTSGYAIDPENFLTTFQDSVGDTDQMIVVKDIDVYSLCEHHLAPFWGKAHVAYLPTNKVIGLSKIPRIVGAFAKRLQVQERLTTQIADLLFTSSLQPAGVAVMLQCRHMCMESRGIAKPGSVTTTSAMRGPFLESVSTRQEFYSIVLDK